MAIKDLLPWKWGEKKVPVKQPVNHETAQHPVDALQHNVNRLFDDFWSGFGLRPFGAFDEVRGLFDPRLDLSETDKELRVTAELPGMDENDIEVSLTSNALTISGEKKAEKEDKGQNYYHLERSYGTFRRHIPLPCEIEADQVEATFKKGLLSISLPKSAQAQKQRKAIPVKTK